MACSGCEVIPMPPQAGLLVLAPNLRHTRKKVTQMLEKEGFSYSILDGGSVGVDMDGQAEQIMAQLGRVLSTTEQESCRSILLRSARDFGLSRLQDIRPLRTMISLAESSWLLDLMRESRVRVHYQPILSARNPVRPLAYECLARGVDSDGNLIPPTQLFDAAREADLMHHLDRLTRVAAIDQAGEHGLRCPLFINFTIPPVSMTRPIVWRQPYGPRNARTCRRKISSSRLLKARPSIALTT